MDGEKTTTRLESPDLVAALLTLAFEIRRSKDGEQQPVEDEIQTYYQRFRNLAITGKTRP